MGDTPRAGGPAAPGQTQRMPVGFRPHFPGVSAGRAELRSPGWEAGRSGGREFGAGERPGRKQQGPGAHPALSPACDPVWTAVASADPRECPCSLPQGEVMERRPPPRPLSRALPDPRAGEAGRNHPQLPLSRAAGPKGICKPCLNPRATKSEASRRRDAGDPQGNAAPCWCPGHSHSGGLGLPSKSGFRLL